MEAIEITNLSENEEGRQKQPVSNLQGAKVWEYKQTGFTMRPSARNSCLEVAKRRLEAGTLGKVIVGANIFKEDCYGI